MVLPHFSEERLCRVQTGMLKGTKSLHITEEELEKILKENISEDLKVKEIFSTIANEKGENYGSLLHYLKVLVQYKDDNDRETLHIMAKTAPPTEFLQRIFDFPISFCKEMNFYKLVNSAYYDLELESGAQDAGVVDLFPPFYGARTSLNGDNDPEADLSAVLLMGNLKVFNYKTRDRIEGLDLKHSELTMMKLAEFHALPIALKQKRLPVFEEKVLKVGEYKPNPDFDCAARTKFCNEFLQALELNNEELMPYFEKIRKRIFLNDSDDSPHGKEPFATIVHNDLWTNNILFAYTQEKFDNPTKIKFIDFQGTIICSPVKDIIFCLLSSAQDNVIDNHFEHLIKLYYDHFIKKLKQLQCNTNNYTWEQFCEEISLYASSEFYHLAVMFTVIYADRSNVKSLENVTSFDTVMHSWNTISKHKLERTVHFFEKKGWL